MLARSRKRGDVAAIMHLLGGAFRLCQTVSSGISEQCVRQWSLGNYWSMTDMTSSSLLRGEVREQQLLSVQ
jgi:hypothetical protein